MYKKHWFTLRTVALRIVHHVAHAQSTQGCEEWINANEQQQLSPPLPLQRLRQPSQVDEIV